MYRIFNDLGGIRRYIMERKLDRAFLDIAGETSARGNIGRIAAELGFEDIAQFSRQFRRRFDATASEIAGLGRDDLPIGYQDPRIRRSGFGRVEPISNWFSQLRA